MDVNFFLKLRTKFIGNFYDEAVKGFLETQRRIQAGEAPYDAPSYNESDEPPFLTEWSEAETSIEVIGRTAIAMLSESLKVYFIQWDEILGIECGKHLKSEFKKGGYWNGYRQCFARACLIDWSQCPVDAEFM